MGPLSLGAGTFTRAGKIPSGLCRTACCSCFCYLTNLQTQTGDTKSVDIVGLGARFTLILQVSPPGIGD